MENVKSLNIKYLLFGIVAILVILIGFSFAFWRVNVEGKGKDVVVNFDSLKIIFTDEQELSFKRDDGTAIKPDWNASKTFSVENVGNSVFFYNINLDELINSFETDGYLQYKITNTSNNGGYNMDDFSSIIKCPEECKQVLATNIAVEVGVKQEYKIEFRYVNDPNFDQSADMKKSFSAKLSIDALNSSITSFFANKYPKATTRTAFDAIVSDGNVYYEEGKWTEKGGRVYYWAGNAEDNWVQFGTDTDGNNLWWRIIRTNEDGGLRLLYAGTGHDKADAYITNIGDNIWGMIEYNKDNYNNTAYVGYMYSEGDTLEAIRENETNSSIKLELDTWYENNLESSYDKYISKTAIYCNDRSTYGESSSEWKSNEEMFYNAYTKFYTNQLDNTKNHPSFKCGVGGDGKTNFDSPDSERKICLV